jgi:hypothetical protein
VCALAIASLLAACGGDGEGSVTPPPQRGGGGVGTPVTPSPGATTAAILDRSRTRDIAVTVLAELGLAETPAERPYLPRIIARGKAVAANVQNPCPGGGSLHEKQNLGSDLTGTIDIAFSDCMQDGARQNGRLSIHIDEFDAASNKATDFGLDFEHLTFAVDQYSVDAHGTARVSIEESVEITALSVTASYQPDALVTRFDDVVVTQTTDGAGVRRLSIAGRIFHSQHGYVDISTLEELVVQNTGAVAPTSGTIRLTGAQNATLDLAFDNQRVRMSLDADANGRVEAGLLATWLELRDTQNFPPVANAGADATVQQGSTVTLNAAASADWEGDALTYAWTLASRPNGSTATVSSSSPTLTFRPDVAGTYDVQVTVRDGAGESTDSVRVTVSPGGTLPPNQRPVANAGLDQVTTERQAVTIDGSLTSDPENDPIVYQWQLTRAPAGSAVAVNATTASFEFTPDLPGVYDLRLTANDGRSSGSDAMRVVADRLIRFVAGAHFRIRGKNLEGDDTAQLGLRTSSHYKGLPVALAVSSSASWLVVATPGATTAAAGDSTFIGVRLNRDELRRLDNGLYAALVIATPVGGQRPAVVEVTLRLRR